MKAVNKNWKGRGKNKKHIETYILRTFKKKIDFKKNTSKFAKNNF